MYSRFTENLPSPIFDSVVKQIFYKPNIFLNCHKCKEPTYDFRINLERVNGILEKIALVCRECGFRFQYARYI